MKSTQEKLCPVHELSVPSKEDGYTGMRESDVINSLSLTLCFKCAKINNVYGNYPFFIARNSTNNRGPFRFKA